MNGLLKLSDGVDAVSHRIGQLIRWLVLASVLISAANAIIRKAFNISSNGFLEIQWYLFAGVFLLGAGFAFMNNVHVRIDFISSKLSKRTNTLIDAVGIVVFLIPLCVIMISLSWPFFVNAFQSGEMSQNAGGLIRWPAYLLMPVGFGLLLAQALSELIKRIAFLKGLRDEPMSIEGGMSDEEKLAEELAAAAAKKLAGG
ncbi:TRAP transporter small permease subunit [Ideonella sp. A 288]|uniref:TRAP transporter small permease subunit n=1 Tax=Ideonella sp. A 288 TaxID=1962181 RepID=UPI000B4BA9AB|nr:TRAP transporter small permease subunit [Ideonella sp. A 288]